MTTRTYDLSENVVPRQGEEAIADTPSAESPSATTDEKRGEEKTTDPTSLDSNPENEDETRSPDERTDVTNLAARRTRAKNSTPIPRLSTQEFSDVLKWIDRTAAHHPRADFGKVVVAGVREYSYRANKNALNVLAAVVPNLLTSGNFDNSDRQALTTLHNQVVAQRKQADDPVAMSGVPTGGADAGGVAAPLSTGDVGGAAAPADVSGAGAAPGGGMDQQQMPVNLAKTADSSSLAPGGVPGGWGGWLGEQVGGPVGEMLGGPPAVSGGPAGDIKNFMQDPLGTAGDALGLPGPAGAAGAPDPIGSPSDPGAPPSGEPANYSHVKRGRSAKTAAGAPGAGAGQLHFDTGDPQVGPVPVQHLQDHGDGTSMIQNEQGQPEAGNNEDLYHDPNLQMPVTQPHPVDQLAPTSPGSGGAPGGAPGTGAAPAGPPQTPPKPPTAPPAPGSGGGDAPPKPPLSDDSQADRGSSPDETPHKDSDKPDDKKTQNPYNSNRRRAGDDTNADGADPEDVRAEDEDNIVDPSKSAAFSRRRRTAEDNLDAAKSDTDTQDVEKPINDTSDRAQQTQYDRGEYDQNGPLLTDPDKSTDQNWPPKASAVDAIRLADMYVDFGLIAPEQKYQVVAGFEKMNGFIVKDRLKVLTAVAETRKTADKNRALVPQSNGKMPSMGRGSSLKEASRNSDFDHFLAL